MIKERSCREGNSNKKSKIKNKKIVQLKKYTKLKKKI